MSLVAAAPCGKGGRGVKKESLERSVEHFEHGCHVAGWRLSDHRTVWSSHSLTLFPVLFLLVFFNTDDLLQEQKADMDQFLSSISESQPDVTVSSSEESVEVPVPEGKPYRPFKVSSLGSHSEPEGETHSPAANPEPHCWGH